MNFKKSLTGIWPLLRQIGLVVLVIVIGNVFWSYQESWGISDSKVLWISVLALALYITYVRNDLLEKIGLHHLSRKWFDSLHFGQPIKPVHEKPKGIAANEWDASDADRRVYNDFAQFADLLNAWFEDESQWRFQEEAKTDWVEGEADMRSHGRRYAVFFNREKMGWLSIRNGYLPDYSRDEPNVTAIVELMNARFISYEKIVALHSALTHHLTYPKDRAEADKIRAELVAQMVRTVWEIGPDAAQMYQLTMTVSGLAFVYLHRAGLRPMEQSTEEAEAGNVVPTFRFDTKVCKPDYPIFLGFVNNSSRTVKSIYFGVDIKRRGYSDSIVDTLSYTMSSLTQDKVLRPGEGFGLCYPMPKLKIAVDQNELVLEPQFKYVTWQ